MINTKEEYLDDLKERAKEIRIKGLQLITKGGVGHPGATLSSADIFSALYYSILNIDPKNPDWDQRDRFVLSKGHGCPPLYVVLAMKGYYEWDELYETYGNIYSRFQGHPDMNKTPGIDMTTGSLGQGLSVAVGMAIAAKFDNKQHRIYCMLGDGETDEGQIWEAVMSASHYQLDNLIAIVDYNKIQAKGRVNEIMSLEPYVDKWTSFGWDVIEIDGHNMEQILDAFYEAKYLHGFGKPVVIIANTVKGKGVSYMENTFLWHTHAPNEQELKIAIDELKNKEGRFLWKR